MSNSSIRPIDTTLLGATTPSQSRPGNNDNEGILYIPQSSSITGASRPDCLVSYPVHSWREVLLFSRDTVGVFYNPSRQGILHFWLYCSRNYFLYKTLVEITVGFVFVLSFPRQSLEINLFHDSGFLSLLSIFCLIFLSATLKFLLDFFYSSNFVHIMSSSFLSLAGKS